MTKKNIHTVFILLSLLMFVISYNNCSLGTKSGLDEGSTTSTTLEDDSSQLKFTLETEQEDSEETNTSTFSGATQGDGAVYYGVKTSDEIYESMSHITLVDRLNETARAMFVELRYIMPSLNQLEYFTAGMIMPIMKMASTFCNILYTSTEINENGKTLLQERFPDQLSKIDQVGLDDNTVNEFIDDNISTFLPGVTMTDEQKGIIKNIYTTYDNNNLNRGELGSFTGDVSATLTENNVDLDNSITGENGFTLEAWIVLAEGWDEDTYTLSSNDTSDFVTLSGAGDSAIKLHYYKESGIARIYSIVRHYADWSNNGSWSIEEYSAYAKDMKDFKTGFNHILVRYNPTVEETESGKRYRLGYNNYEMFINGFKQDVFLHGMLTQNGNLPEDAIGFSYNTEVDGLSDENYVLKVDSEVSVVLNSLPYDKNNTKITKQVNNESSILSIGQVSLWTRAITDSEISTRYNSRVPSLVKEDGNLNDDLYMQLYTTYNDETSGALIVTDNEIFTNENTEISYGTHYLASPLSIPGDIRIIGPMMCTALLSSYEFIKL